MPKRPLRTNLDRAQRTLRRAAASTRRYQWLQRWEEIGRKTIGRAKRGMSKARRRIDRELETEES